MRQGTATDGINLAVRSRGTKLSYAQSYGTIHIMGLIDQGCAVIYIMMLGPLSIMAALLFRYARGDPSFLPVLFHSFTRSKKKAKYIHSFALLIHTHLDHLQKCTSQLSSDSWPRAQSRPSFTAWRRPLDSSTSAVPSTTDT